MHEGEEARVRCVWGEIGRRGRRAMTISRRNAMTGTTERGTAGELVKEKGEKKVKKCDVTRLRELGRRGKVVGGMEGVRGGGTHGSRLGRTPSSRREISRSSWASSSSSRKR